MGTASNLGYPDGLALALRCLQQLMEEQQFQCAELLAGYAASMAIAAPADAVPSSTRADILMMRADALSALGEHRRALFFYRQAAVQMGKATSATHSQNAPPSLTSSRHINSATAATAAAPALRGSSSSNSPFFPAHGGSGSTMGCGAPGTLRAGQLANQAPGHRHTTAAAAAAAAAAAVNTAGGGTVMGATQAQGAGLAAADGVMAVKLKTVDCYVKLKEYKAAIAELDSIPSKQRTLRANMTLGQLNHACGHARAACAANREAVRQCPCALTAIAGWVQLGASVKDVMQLLPQGGRAGRPTPNVLSGTAAQEPADSTAWLQRFTEAMVFNEANQFAACAQQWTSLLRLVGVNSHALVECARAQTAQGLYEAAMVNLLKARTLDPHAVEGTDDTALLLLLHRVRTDPHRPPLPVSTGKAHANMHPHVHGSVATSVSIGGSVDEAELGRVTAEVIATAPHRVESLVTAAAFWHCRGEMEQALVYVDKAVDMNESHVPALVLKAWLQLHCEPCDAAGAAVSFRRAYALRPQLRILQGLVRSYLRVPKYKEALAAANEAAKAFSTSGSALALLAEVYLQLNRKEKARKVLEAAVKQQPRSMAAVFALADVHLLDDQVDDAVHLLEEEVESARGAAVVEAVQCKLGYVRLHAKQLHDAIMHFQTVLGVNPLSHSASKGMALAEEQMKGASQVDEEGSNLGVQLTPLAEDPFFL